jgi:hypothetical protein
MITLYSLAEHQRPAALFTSCFARVKRASGAEPFHAILAAKNKCLARNNKSRHVSDATKKHGAIRAKNKRGLLNVVI